jgi:DNA ligase-1
LELFRPIAPMLAGHAESVEQALEEVDPGGTTARAAIEWKVDGVRAQIHKAPGRVAVFSRQGNDMTAGCAPLLPELAALRAETLVLDAEIALVDASGKARAFQDSLSALSSTGITREGDRLQLFLFDCLHRDGVDLLDAPLEARLEALQAVAPEELVVARLRTRDPSEAAAFYTAARAAGHEGVMVKDLRSPYQLGSRGRAWQKVKEHTTVDLVVLAVEWGSGRRKGLLSNLHLGARRADGSFCMVGKTFKGLTDAMLRWQTEHLQALAETREDHVVLVRPELVVEIRFNDVQRSPRYPGGIALRFARVVRFRQDKLASEIEALDALIARLPEAAVPGATGRPTRGKIAAARRQLSLFDDER